MQDIDFDELDRAVNSAINSSTSSTSDDAPSVQPEKEAAAAPVEKTEVKPEAPAKPASAASSSPAARRSTGRFMDVVHPSSDMRPQPSGVKPAESAVEKPAPAPAQVEEAPASLSSADFKWPDPIDMHSNEEPEEAPVEEKEVVVPEAPAATEPAPLDSPFLPDAKEKVEKRPLGGTPPSEPTLDLADVLKDFTPKAADLTIPEETKVASTGAVDLSSLEISEEALIGSSETSDTSPDKAPVESQPIPVAAETATSATERPLTVPSEASVNKPLVNDSIAQQYKEQPSTVDQPSGAIYDTEAYHQPLAHPPKKNSSLKIILWIVGLIIIGGGLGAVLYLYVLPAL